MKQEKYSFFKYSKATQLTNYGNVHDRLQAHTYKKWLLAAMNGFKKTMNEMKTMGSYDNWWTSLLKSIYNLDIGSRCDIGVLLSAMPVDILFNPNPNVSRLNKIVLGHYVKPDHNYKSTWNEYMNQFEQEYLQWKEKWEGEGLKIK